MDINNIFSLRSKVDQAYKTYIYNTLKNLSRSKEFVEREDFNNLFYIDSFMGSDDKSTNENYGTRLWLDINATPYLYGEDNEKWVINDLVITQEFDGFSIHLLKENDFFWGVERLIKGANQ